MFYYMSTGNATGDKYIFASDCEIDNVSNCFPISETTSNFCEISEDEIDGVIHLMISPIEDMKRAIPIKNLKLLKRYIDGEVDLEHVIDELTTYLGIRGEALVKALGNKSVWAIFYDPKELGYFCAELTDGGAYTPGDEQKYANDTGYMYCRTFDSEDDAISEMLDLSGK